MKRLLLCTIVLCLLSGSALAAPLPSMPLTFTKEGKPAMLKSMFTHNPVMVQRFGADPWAMVYDGRVYLYMTGDDPQFDENGQPLTNTYGNINRLHVLSSSDLVNWVDHGAIAAAGKDGAAAWAKNSWAPAAAWKNIDGKDRFFLYFADSGRGIGVLCGDSPLGPFTDPLGGPLVSRSTPTCASVTWLFDPAVMVDEDGRAYLYFGGGIPEGKAAAPGTARAVELGEDMISLKGAPVTIDPPYLFEDSGIHKVNGTYYYSYCTNFQVPDHQAAALGFSSGEICYMTAENPLGPFTFGGRIFKNPGHYFGAWGNNHHCIFQFEGKWYIAYHAQALEKKMGWDAGYRSTCINDLPLDASGAPKLATGDQWGVAQVRPLPMQGQVPAETIATLSGMTTIADAGAQGGMALRSLAPGGWAGILKGDFGEGVSSLSLRYRSKENCTLIFRPDRINAAPAAEISLAPADAWQVISVPLNVPLSGVHDLYFQFDQAGVEVDWWQFQ